MENLKICVNSKAESKEAQELFVKYGATGNMCLDQSIRYVCTFNGALTQYDFLPSIEFKRITLPELRDLVVLKRNDVGDATHENYTGLKYLLLTHTRHAWGGDKWLISSADFSKLKPIEKKEMKEYLDKQQDGTYKLIKASSGCIDRDWIEIPEGANYAYNNDQGLCFLSGSLGDNHPLLIWQRPTHPEELPFIDDEPSLGNSKIGRRAITVKVPVESLNDQYAEIEKVRQSHRTASETADPTIKETLSQRQAQYGDFKDVADTTERLFKTIKDGNSFDDFTNDQRMALYMICSKMARIVNGNPNHKDSWHDIAGYATLIDEVL